MPVSKGVVDMIREAGVRRRTDVKARAEEAAREIAARHGRARSVAARRIYLAAAGLSEAKIDAMEADPGKWGDARLAAAAAAVDWDQSPGAVMESLVRAGVLTPGAARRSAEEAGLTAESDQPEDLAMEAGGIEAMVAVLEARVEAGRPPPLTEPPSRAGSARHADPAAQWTAALPWTRPNAPAPADPPRGSAGPPPARGRLACPDLRARILPPPHVRALGVPRRGPPLYVGAAADRISAPGI